MSRWQSIVSISSVCVFVFVCGVQISKMHKLKVGPSTWTNFISANASIHCTFSHRRTETEWLSIVVSKSSTVKLML